MTSRRPHALFRLFHMLLNSPVLFAAIQELVDCGADRFPTRKNVDERGRKGQHLGGGVQPENPIQRQAAATEPDADGEHGQTARTADRRALGCVRKWRRMTAKREPSTLFAWPAGRNLGICARRTRRTVP